MINGAKPKVIQGTITSFSSFKYLTSSLNIVLLLTRNLITKIIEINCEMIVANAAPLTFKPKTKIKIGSKIILQIAPIIVAFILTLVKP